MQLPKEQSGDLISQSGTGHHSVPTRKLSHTVREQNQEAVQVGHVRADILHSPPHAHISHLETCPTQCVLSAPTPLPIYTLQGLTFRNRERHIRALGTVTAWGRTGPGRGQNPQERNWRRHFEEDEPPMASCLHPHRGLRNHPLHTYLQPGCRSVLFHL